MKIISSKQIGNQLGNAGGQGTVFEDKQDSSMLIKIYHPEVRVDVDGLESLVRWREELNSKDRALLDRSTSWPFEVVTVAQDHKLGVRFQKAPRKFFHTVDGKTMPRELGWAYLDSAAFSGVELPSARHAISLLKQFAQVLSLFHRNRVVYGDVSHDNVLFSCNPSGSEIFLIDCDSSQVLGEPRGLLSVQTPLWDCPWDNANEIERDNYKLAVAFLRVYLHYHGPIAQSTQELAIADGHHPMTEDLIQLLQDGLARTTDRPPADEWVQGLTQLERALHRQIPM